MTRNELNGLSILALAHVGDAVYELLARTYLAGHGQNRVVNLHRATVAMVKAPAQAKAAAVIVPLLTEEELAVYKRGRNSHVNSVPRGASKAEYHAATACSAGCTWPGKTGACTSCLTRSWKAASRSRRIERQARPSPYTGDGEPALDFARRKGVTSHAA